MATTAQWVAPEAVATSLSTELNSLANAAFSAVSAAINNESGLYLFINLELVLASLIPTGTPYVAVYAVKSIDNGTNFEDGGGSTAPRGQPIAIFDFSTATAAKRVVRENILIPPLQFKLVAENRAGVAFAASGNTVRYRRHNQQSV